MLATILIILGFITILWLISSWMDERYHRKSSEKEHLRAAAQEEERRRYQYLETYLGDPRRDA